MPLSDIARAVEDRFHRESIPVLKRKGWRPRVISYDGYGTTGSPASNAAGRPAGSMARILARMVMRPPDAPDEGPLFSSLPARLPASAAQARDIAGVCNERGNVVGLMPHPEHATESGFGPASQAGPRTGTDGLGLFRSAIHSLLSV